MDQRSVFISGYDETNLQISKEKGILGWKMQSKRMKHGDYVFIYNTTSKKIDCLFEVNFKVENLEPLWDNELKFDSIIYKVRWKANLIIDNLNISLDEISRIKPYDSNLRKFTFNTIRQPYPTFLNEMFPEFAQFLLQRTGNIRSAGQMQQEVLIKNDKVQYYLVQVSKNGSKNLIENSVYRHLDWQVTPRDSDHGKVRVGDILLVYFSSGAVKYQMTLKKTYKVIQISKDNSKFDVKETLDLHGLSLNEIKDLVQQGLLKKETFGKISQQGFNIIKITREEYDFVIDLDNKRSPGFKDKKMITANNIQPSYNNSLNQFQDDEKILQISSEEIESGYLEISKKLMIPKQKIIEIVIALSSGRHVLLSGPIGTGKTELARLIPKNFWKKVGGYHAEIYTATADWSTQNVIGGIMPLIENEKITYGFHYGCALETIRKNWSNGERGGSRIKYKFEDNEYNGVWLIIDEFNRADIDKAFGDLFTALRTKNLKIMANDNKKYYMDIKIPEDYRIICTLNVSDKHFLFRLSDALKSRFAFIEIDIPHKQSDSDHDEEMYYAVKNAIDSIGINSPKIDSIIILDHDHKRIDKDKSVIENYNMLRQAYAIFQIIRLLKKLGTGILQIIYQHIIVGITLDQSKKWILGSALCSTLIPQLEGLSSAEIEFIESIINLRLIDFFKEGYKDSARQSYLPFLEKIINFLKIEDKSFYVDYEKGNLDTTLETDWDILQKAQDNIKNNLIQAPENFLYAIKDLKQTSLM